MLNLFYLTHDWNIYYLINVLFQINFSCHFTWIWTLVSNFITTWPNNHRSAHLQGFFFHQLLNIRHNESAKRVLTSPGLSNQHRSADRHKTRQRGPEWKQRLFFFFYSFCRLRQHSGRQPQPISRHWICSGEHWPFTWSPLLGDKPRNVILIRLGWQAGPDSTKPFRNPQLAR